jgi:hypothetical protein
VTARKREAVVPKKTEKKEVDARALVVDPDTAGVMLDKSKDGVYDLLRCGELESYLDGKSRRITVASIKRYIDRRLALSREFTRYRHPMRASPG